MTASCVSFTLDIEIWWYLTNTYSYTYIIHFLFKILYQREGRAQYCLCLYFHVLSTFNQTSVSKSSTGTTTTTTTTTTAAATANAGSATAWWRHHGAVRSTHVRTERHRTVLHAAASAGTTWRQRGSFQDNWTTIERGQWPLTSTYLFTSKCNFAE